MLDEALNGLPTEFRAPLILCCLNRQPHADVARHLGVPAGSIAKRLRLAYESLRNRLCRRGLTLSSEVLALLLSHRAASIAVPVALVDSTVEMAIVNVARSDATADGIGDAD